jgi:hypothetical protein
MCGRLVLRHESLRSLGLLIVPYFPTLNFRIVGPYLVWPASCKPWELGELLYPVGNTAGERLPMP